MGVGEATKHLGTELDDLSRGERPLALQKLAKRLALHVLHHQYRRPCLQGRVVDPNQVGVVELGEDGRLVPKLHRPFRHCALQRHPATEVPVLSKPHNAEGAGAKMTLQTVTAENDQARMPIAR